MKYIGGYAWIIVVLLAIVLAGNIIVEQTGHYKIATNLVDGESMSVTYPDGTLLVWAYYPTGGVELRDGDVGCFNDPLVASMRKMDKFIICHWYNGTRADGMLMFHSDPIMSECKNVTGVTGRAKECPVYYDVVEPSNVRGKVLVSATSPGQLIVLVVMVLAAGYYAYAAYMERKEKQDAANEQQGVPPAA